MIRHISNANGKHAIEALTEKAALFLNTFIHRSIVMNEKEYQSMRAGDGLARLLDNGRMTQLRAMEVTGSDAPDTTATLRVVRSDYCNGWDAYYDAGFCGCAECHCLVGHGETAEEAVEDYWLSWTDKYIQ